MYVEKLTIDVKKLIKSGLSIEQYFVLTCLANNYQELLEKYVDSSGKIDKSVFSYLIDDGWVLIDGDSIIFSNIKITQKSIELFELSNKLDYKRFFQELKDTYPKRIKIGPKKFRSLHQNLEDCERKYKAIVDSEDMHNKILKCVKMYVQEVENAGKAEFMQMLSTWINQKNYLMYIDDVDNYVLAEEIDTHNIV